MSEFEVTELAGRTVTVKTFGDALVLARQWYEDYGETVFVYERADDGRLTYRSAIPS